MTLGELLRQAREERGLTLAAVEESTKISIRMLRLLEGASHVGLPPAVYARGLIRRYAEYLGIDPDRALALFPIQDDPVLIPPAPRVPRSNRFGLLNVLTAAALIGAIAVIFGWVYDRTYVERPAPAPIAMPFSVDSASRATAGLIGGGSDRTESVVTSRARGAPAGPRAEVPTVPDADADLANGVRPTAGRPMTIEIRAVEPTSVTVRVDGTAVFSGELLFGDRRTFVGAQDVSVHTTNAGGVEILRNGQAIGLLGRPFEVAERTWTAGP